MKVSFFRIYSLISLIFGLSITSPITSMIPIGLQLPQFTISIMNNTQIPLKINQTLVIPAGNHLERTIHLEQSPYSPTILSTRFALYNAHDLPNNVILNIVYNAQLGHLSCS